MTPDPEFDGIAWDVLPMTGRDPSERGGVARAYATVFASHDGALVLGHLRRSVLDRRLPPHASEAELRHLEGQRCLVAQMLALIEQGRRPPTPPITLNQRNS